MTPILAVSIAWTWIAFWLWCIAYAIGRAAWVDDGWPVCRPNSCKVREDCRWLCLKWPITGRWILTIAFIVLGAVFTEVAKVAWDVYRFDFPTRIGWVNAIIRITACLIFPMVFYRQWRFGLLHDFRQEKEIDSENTVPQD